MKLHQAQREEHTCGFVLDPSQAHDPLLVDVLHHVTHLILHREHLQGREFTRCLYITAAVMDLFIIEVRMMHELCM